MAIIRNRKNTMVHTLEFNFKVDGAAGLVVGEDAVQVSPNMISWAVGSSVSSASRKARRRWRRSIGEPSCSLGARPDLQAAPPVPPHAIADGICRAQGGTRCST